MDDDDDDHSSGDTDEKLSCLIADIKRQLYIACFVLELIRAYVALAVPHNE